MGALGQFKQPYRFERELKTSEEGVTVISLKKEGLAFVRDMNKYEQGKKRWQLEVVDTTLSSVWLTEFELETRLILVGYEYSHTQLFLLFREGESEMHNLELLTLHLPEKSFQKDKIKFELNFKLTHFTIAGSSALFGGYVSGEPAVLLYNQSSDKPKVLPGLFMKDIALLDIRTNQNQSFNVLLAERRGIEKKRLVVRTYDQDGNLLIDDVIDVDPKYSILSGLTSALERDEMIILGTYGENNERQALGFFSVVVDPFNEQAVSYTDLSSLQHLLDYLPGKKSGKIKEKAQKQKNLSHLPNYKAYVVPIRIEEKSNGFYLLAEMYTQSTNFDLYPTSPNYNPYSNGYSPTGASPFSNRSYSAPYPYNPPRNPSVEMIQTMVMQFGGRGQVEKDVSMKLDDIRQPGLEQVGDFLVAGDSVFMTYKKEGEIFYQNASGDPEEKSSIKQAKVKLLSPYDALKNEDEDTGGVRFWYDQHFFVWGFQTIKNSTIEGNQTRHVFYVNKISPR